VALLREIKDGRIMVFANTRVATDKVNRTLNANGLHSVALSGQVPQKKRQTLLRQFHDGEIPVLVATDVAARGLHIPDVTHVFNFDLPQDAPDYVHRIGRTARLGARGEAISFACENFAFHLPEIEEFIGYTIPVVQEEVQPLPEIKIPPPPPRRPRGQRPPRKSGGHRGGKGKDGQGNSRGRHGHRGKRGAGKDS
jgi:ATP-dependent RNA helicase RhlB